MIYYINENSKYDIFELAINTINDIDNLYINFVEESYITDEGSDKESMVSKFAKTIASIFKKIGKFFADLVKKIRDIVNGHKNKRYANMIKNMDKNTLDSTISTEYYSEKNFQNCINEMNKLLDDVNHVFSSGKLPDYIPPVNTTINSTGSDRYNGKVIDLIKNIDNINMYSYPQKAEEIYTKISDACNKVADRFLAEISSISVDYINEKRKNDIIKYKSYIIANGSKQLRILNIMISRNESVLNKISNKNNSN